MKAVALLRRSTNMQDKSIEEQRQFVAGWARANGYTILAEHVDDAISGDDHGHRSGFQRLMQELDSPSRAWKLILAYDRARFTRADIYEAATYADRILKAGADVVYCAEGKSLSTDHEIVWAVETFQKHEVLKQTSRDTLRGLMALARKGYWCGGPIPYGYDAEIIDKLTQQPVRRVRLIRRLRTLPDGSKLPAIHHILDTNGQFVREVVSSTETALPLKSEAELTRLVFSDATRVEAVRLIFELFANKGRGYKSIASELNARGNAPPGGHGLWRTSAVHAMVRNALYRGLLEWNCRTEAKYNSIQNGTMVPRPRSDKARVVANDERDRIRNEIPGLAIVTPELWHRAQKVRSLRDNVDFRQSEQMHGTSMLAGKLHCMQCGARMYGFNTRKKKMVGGTMKEFVTRVYLCSTYTASGKDFCGFNKAPRAQVDRYALAKIREMLAPFMGGISVHQRIKTRLRQTLGAGPTMDPATLRKRLAAVEKKIRILEGMETRDRTEIGMEGAYHQAKEEQARLAKQLQPVGTEKTSAVDLDSVTADVGECLRNLENFDRIPAEAQKALFTRFIQKIELTYERVMLKGRRRSVFKKGVLTLDARFGWPYGALGAGNETGAPSEEGPSFKVNGSGGLLPGKVKLVHEFGPEIFESQEPPTEKQ